jgi:hypothetical protein
VALPSVHPQPVSHTDTAGDKALVWMFCDESLLHLKSAARITWKTNKTEGHAGTLFLTDRVVRVYEPNTLGIQILASEFANDKCENEMKGGWCQTASLFYMEEMLLNEGESFSDQLMIGFGTLLQRLQGRELKKPVSMEELTPHLKDLPFIRRFIELFGFDPTNSLCALTNFLRALAKRYDDLQTTLFGEFVTKLVSGKGTGGHDETRRLV